MTDQMSGGAARIARAVLRVGRDGHVKASSAGAAALFGRRPVGACAAVVHAVDAHGVRLCLAGCAATLAGPGAPPAARELAGVTVRGCPARMRCECVGDEVVVTLSWSDTPVGALELLTDREREVLGWVATGLTDRRIARRLGVQPSTVRTHVEHARAKLGATTRAHAVARAIATGQVETD